MECDVTDTAAVDAAFTAVEAEHGPVEVLVSNAGMTDDTLLLRMSEDQFSRVLDTNLTAAYRVCKRAAGKMLRARSGRIVLVSSVVALTGSAGQTNYAAAKAGLIGFGRSLARELGSRGITVNVVLPGFVQTDMTAVLPDERGRDDQGAGGAAAAGDPGRGGRGGHVPGLGRRLVHHRRGGAGGRRTGDGALRWGCSTASDC